VKAQGRLWRGPQPPRNFCEFQSPGSSERASVARHWRCGLAVVGRWARPGTHTACGHIGGRHRSTRRPGLFTVAMSSPSRCGAVVADRHASARIERRRSAGLSWCSLPSSWAGFRAGCGGRCGWDRPPGAPGASGSWWILSANRQVVTRPLPSSQPQRAERWSGQRLDPYA